MALLVTSCTMGKQPNRLLDKGPNYLRTRTNSKLFAGRRRSAVELLEASKPQYVKSNSVRDQRPISLHFSESFSILDRSSGTVTTTQPPRSKSEYNLSQLRADYDSDARDDSIDGDSKLVTGVEGTQLQHPQQHNLLACRRTQQKSTEAVHRKINMSERTPEITSSSPGRRPPCIDANASKTVNSGALGSRDPYQSISCQNLGEMAADKPREMASVKTDQVGESSVKDTDTTDKTCTPVHRSHSDLNCRHARDSSVASDKSARYSRASADLENFFNQMGLERNVLDPMLRLQEHQGEKKFDMFESVSSLDSPDTRSICSGVSRSEKALSDTEAGDKQHSTSVVERNARIIKWLCSVKKAKTNFPGHS